MRRAKKFKIAGNKKLLPSKRGWVNLILYLPNSVLTLVSLKGNKREKIYCYFYSNWILFSVKISQNAHAMIRIFAKALAYVVNSFLITAS